MTFTKGSEEEYKKLREYMKKFSAENKKFNRKLTYEEILKVAQKKAKELGI